MLKIYIPENHKHRNECLFRPYLTIQDYFRDIGIEFVFSGNNWDLAWIGQASYIDKSLSLKYSTKKGLEFVEKFKGKDYILFDGQDSASLIGTWEVFKESEAKLLLKNSLYEDLKQYENNANINGRIYWERPLKNHDPNLSHDLLLDETNLNPKFKNVKLSGTNWLSTVQPNFFQYKEAKKDIDVFAMFQYPAKENWEYGVKTSEYYSDHRQNCIEELKKFPESVRVVTAENGKVPLEEYYSLMSRSKIVIAPFGYGEIAPRDLESAMVGAILIKPSMDHISTLPNVFIPGTTYVSCSWDYLNLVENIGVILQDYRRWQEYYVENMRQKYVEEYNPEKLVIHVHKILSELEGYST